MLLKINCVLLIFSVSLSLVISEKKSSFDCEDNGLQKMDDAAASMVGFTSDRKFPTTVAEVETFCKDQKEFQKTVKTFVKKCLNGFSKTLINVAVYQNDKIHKGYCGKRKEKFMSWGECMNQKRDENKKCFDKMVEKVNLVRFESDNKKKFPLICCHFYAAKKCTLDNLKKSWKQILSYQEGERNWCLY